ncbi:MAG: tyrosine recombinase XerC [Gemmatimonadetes bacterium]|nr:tyrosine recombinase XerC [Gemmatimonadota bacterium]
MAALSASSTVEEGIESFLEYLEKERNYAAHTLGSYRSDLQQFARFLYPRVVDVRLPLKLVQRELVAAFIEELEDRGLQRSSIARKLAAVRSFFRYLCRERVLAGNPASGIGSPRPERRSPPSLELKQVEQALELPEAEKASGARDRAILEVFYGGGIRLSELVGLNLTSLDLDAGTVRVMGKGRKERIVPIGRMALATLKDYMRHRAELLLELDITQVEVGALFLNGRGRRLSRRTVQRVVQRYLDRATETEGAEGEEVEHKPGMSPHLLRHTFATHLLDAGADLQSVKELLGHATLTSTQIYTEITLERMQEVYAQAHPRSRGAEGGKEADADDDSDATPSTGENQ